MIKAASLLIAFSVAAATAATAQSQLNLRSGYFPREKLSTVGSTFQSANNTLLIASIRNAGSNKSFFVWRDDNLYSVTAGCEEYSGSLIYAESHPQVGVQSGKASRGQGMYRVIEFACEQR